MNIKALYRFGDGLLARNEVGRIAHVDSAGRISSDIRFIVWPPDAVLVPYDEVAKTLAEFRVTEAQL